ncbi:MAG: hypothetical protein AAGF23_20815 [Acidobacteriota bacterium]
MTIKARLLMSLPVLFGLALAGCATTGGAPDLPTETTEKHVFRVALFPWIPDAAEDGFESLRSSLEEKFEEAHPQIDLHIRLEKWDDSYYSPAKIAGWLASDEFDVVEIDTVILGDLVKAEVIEPWPAQDASTFFRAAVQGSTIAAKDGGTVWWGVPHLLCGFFIVSQSPAIDGAQTLTELVDAVERTGLPLLGNFDSSWDLPSLYLDSRVDNALDPSDLQEAVKPPLDTAAAAAVKELAALCDLDGDNPCVDGTYGDAWNAPVEKFLAGEAAGFWGYSERLHLTVKSLLSAGAPISDIRVTTIPLGSQATPLLFTDALVRRRGCGADADCERASAAFAEFINSDWAVKEVLLSGDAASVGKEAIPRYLLPATRSAFDIDGIRDDRIYGELRIFAESGYSLPNDGELYERRRVIAWLLGQELEP